MVPRLQSEKDRLGLSEENPNITSKGKRQAELDADEPIASSTYTPINHDFPGPNAELAFSGQFRQRKRARISQRTMEKNEGLTRPMVPGSDHGMNRQVMKGRSSEVPSGLVTAAPGLKNERRDNQQKVQVRP